MELKHLSLVFLGAFVLLFGCINLGGSSGGTGLPNVTVTGPSVQVQPSSGPCTPDYSFSPITNSVLSQSEDLVATVSCAGGIPLTANVDGVPVDTQIASDNATTPLTFKLVAIKDGTSKVTVTGNGQTLLSKDWVITPLGSSDIKGVENDAVSFSEWRAESFNVENAVNLGTVKLYLKRLSSQTQPGTNVVVEVRKDNAGSPGVIVDSVKRPITDTTLSDNWISFAFPATPLLASGKYWVALRIEQSESVRVVSDSVNWHYVTIARDPGSGNAYTRQMILNVDSKTGVATESSWNPLSYNRVYSVTVSAAK